MVVAVATGDCVAAGFLLPTVVVVVPLPVVAVLVVAVFAAVVAVVFDAVVAEPQ